MSTDCYRIEVLHFLNPHLVWVEVVDKAKECGFIFEQIGLYGILPLEPVLDVVGDNLKTRISDNWLPAASATIKNALSESKEIWFTTTYIDRRGSIFDDNIHKYGEIFIKKANGKFYTLSMELTKSGFALYDDYLFHQELGNGNLKTKLQSLEAQEVIRNIENFYEKKNVSKMTLEKSIKTNTVVTRASQEFEMALTEMNLEKHNKDLMTQVLLNKMKDFEMCKGIEEESVGRAYKAKPKKQKLDTDSVTTEYAESEYVGSPKSVILKRKLQLMSSKKLNKTDNDADPILPERMNISEEKAYNSCNEKNNMFIENKSDDLLQNEARTNTLSGDENEATDQNSHSLKDSANKEKIPQRVMKRTNGSKFFQTKVTYGPPGISRSVLPYKTSTQCDWENKQISTSSVENAEDNTMKEGMFDNVDSNDNAEVTNKYILLDMNQVRKNENDNISTSKTLAGAVENEIMDISKQSDIRNASHDDSSSDVAMGSSKSGVLKKKLMLHQGKVAKTLNSSVTSDITNKETSSSTEEINTKQKDRQIQDTKSSDDENIDEVIKIIKKEYPVVNSLPEKNTSQSRIDMDNSKSAMKTSVNPFKNIDPSISSFTDKVISPVLMVHTKMNKRIEPVYKISDVHFNKFIQVVLKKMSIVRPMMLQTISWSCILRGYSTFMVSPAGSGKTLGYLPAVCRLITDSCPEDSAGIGPKCIILCATSKSVADVTGMARTFLGVKERVLSCFAGLDITDSINTLLGGCEMIITTPPFLVRLLQTTESGMDLRRLATVVLDDCERISEVFRNEIKYIFYMIKRNMKSRTNKELKVQYVLASRIWCDFMEPIAKKAPYSVVCFGAFQECVLYSKANVSMKFVQMENKINSVHDFLDNIDLAKKIVIVCNTDAEVNTLRRALEKYNNTKFACDSSVALQDLYNVSVAWNDYEDPLLGPILVCCDDTLIHLNITDAHYLLNYSLPPLHSTFCKRFAVLNENYRSIFKDSSSNVKIETLIEESNMEQLPKMVSFIKRCTDNIPEELNKICDSVLAEKDCVKALNCVPICDSLLSFGYCADFWNCMSRHSVFKEYDESLDWIPKSGLISFKILHYHTAVLYSVRLLSHVINGKEIRYPQTYSTLSLQMGLFYSRESNKQPHGIPNIGDLCAVSLKQNFFARCQVVKILSVYPQGNPNSVLVKLIDEETLEITTDISLYHLPDDLKTIKTHVALVRLANVQPKDRDVTFSDMAREELRIMNDSQEDLFLRGNAVMTLGNCIYIDSLISCQELSSLNKIIVKFDLRHELLERHANRNNMHMYNIKKLCEGKINMPGGMTQMEHPRDPATLPRGTWVHLESDDISLVYFGYAISPHTFFVRLKKSSASFTHMMKDIQMYIAENPEPVLDVKVNDIVLAMFPGQNFYERARIEAIVDCNMVQCFFLDEGEWSEVTFQHIVPIKEEFITRMPFQAIECRLVGVQPAGDHWTDFSTNWFSDQCYDTNIQEYKALHVKYCYREEAEFTGGNKYGIVMIDTYGEVDVVINQLMIDLSLAQESIDEMKYLKEINVHTKNLTRGRDNESPLNENDYKTEECMIRESTEPASLSTSQTVFQEPIISEPLVDSDSDSNDFDDADLWQINMTDDFLDMFLPATNTATAPPISQLVSITPGEASQDKAQQTDEVFFPNDFPQNQSAPQQLNSNDCASPQCSEGTVKSRAVEQVRKPRLVWRQNRNCVVIKINLIGLQMYDLTIQGRSINFAANTNGVDYVFDLELYGAIDVKSSSHCNKGQYVLVKLSKLLNKNWLTLTRDGAIRKWVVYDVDSLEISSDEDEIDEQTKNMMLNAIKGMIKDDESESEDDDFIDDINFGQMHKEVLYHE